MPRTVVTLTSNHFPAIAARLPQAAAEIVEEAAYRIEAAAKAIVPVDTGNLKNSLTAEPENETTWIVYTNVSYSIFVEFGTVHQAAQPYLTPAAESERPRFMAAMRDLESRLG